MNKLPTKNLIAVALISFPLLLAIDWTGITGKRFPKSWDEAVIQIGINLVWTVLLTVAYYFVIMRPFSRPK